MNDYDLPLNTVLTNKEITEIFGCQFEGGIRKSKKNHLLVLINDSNQRLYQNYWENGTLYFTSIGKEGDQSLASPWQNRELSQVHESQQRTFLFNKLKPAHYQYLGEVTVGTPQESQQKDSNGQMRRVYLFPLTLKNKA